MRASYRVIIQVEPAFKRWASVARLRTAARAALRHQQALPPAELTVRVTTDQALRDLNRQFLGEDHVTDVLSFPAGDVDPATGVRYLGDLAIAYPRARDQAKAARHPVWAEMQLLVVHGVLHLLGHDHAEPGEKARMWSAQAEILRSVGQRHPAE